MARAGPPLSDGIESPPHQGRWLRPCPEDVHRVVGRLPRFAGQTGNGRGGFGSKPGFNRKAGLGNRLITTPRRGILHEARLAKRRLADLATLPPPVQPRSVDGGIFFCVTSWMHVVTGGSATGRPWSCLWGTPEALKRVARGAKQPRVMGTPGVTYPGRGCRLPNLRTPAGVRIQIDTPFPGYVLRTTRGYRLQRLRRTDSCWQLETSHPETSLET